MALKFNILSLSGKGKGFKIFQSSSYKEHQQKPMAQLFWKMRWAAGIWLVSALVFIFAFPAEHIWRYGWSPATWDWISIYFQNALTSGGLSVLAEIPPWFMRMVLQTDMPSMVPLFPVVLYYILLDSTFMSEFNPHKGDAMDEKSSGKASESDLKKMGLLGGFMMVLGYFKKKPLQMDECLSALCLAPPGTGKSQGVVFPTIFDTPGASMIINDPKPELKQKSSAYRATVGPVFIMNWAGQDDPARGIYYPSWNPLSPKQVPFNPEERDLYIDSIVAVLISEKSSSANDPYWMISGRSTLSGMIQFMVSKIERAKANDYFYHRIKTGAFDEEDANVLHDYYAAMVNDPNSYAAINLLERGELNEMNYVHIGTWANIPDAWVGREASLSMLLDWLNASQLKAAEKLNEMRAAGDQMALMGADPLKDTFTNAVDEAIQYAYAHRCVVELTQTANTPDKERGSILSTVMAGLAIFRNAAVRNRTSHSDFHFEDLRGMVDPRDGKSKPVTVYLSINMVDAEALNPITGIFIELMSSFLLSNPPENMHHGKKLGKYPVLFVLDEMPKMQKLQAVIQGPDLGRGQKISYLMIGQDIHQISEKYGSDAAATIMSTTAAKIVLRQNDIDTAKKFSELMGQKISIKKDKDGKESKSAGDLYSPMDIMSLDDKKQLVIFQGWYHRPIEADKQMAFKDERLKKFMEMGESSPMPEFLIPSHHKILGYPGKPKILNPKTGEIKELDE